jgi:peptide chain release factor 1
VVNLELIKQEYEELLTKLSDPELISDWEKFEALSKKKNQLEKIIEKAKEIEEIKNKIEENKSIVAAGEDLELVSLAETEIAQLKEREKKLNEELGNLLSQETSEKEPQSVIVEIRAGTGGEEAALFAADLFKMYSKYADSKKWKKNVLDCHYSDLGGIKEIIFELKDGDVFSQMQYEGGVHRVQRIPETEKSGRIHTSTATVAVLPKPKKTEIKINPNDLKIETYKASGPGGQYVNKRMTAVRITHLPTGMVVTSQTERNLQQNKENAISILAARLLEKKEMRELEKLSEERKSQIKWAKRAEKIRTYNFPQNRVTDHRIKKSWHNLEEIMEGKLDPVIESLSTSFEK